MMSQIDRKYACPKCGNGFDAFKVDDTFQYASRYTCEYLDYKEQSYSCDNCDEIIKLYWHAEKHNFVQYNMEGMTRLQKFVWRYLPPVR